MKSLPAGGVIESVDRIETLPVCNNEYCVGLVRHRRLVPCQVARFPTPASSWELRIAAEPFSAIMKVGAFVFADVIRGITDASITRRFSKPRTFKFGSTTESASLPIRQVPTGWKTVPPLWRT